METEYYKQKKDLVARTIAKGFEGNLTCEEIAKRVMHTLNLTPWEKKNESSGSHPYKVPSQGC